MIINFKIMTLSRLFQDRVENKLICLGIESTAHTFSCAILEKTNSKTSILSDVKKTYIPPSGEGIHPREASRHHIQNSPSLLSKCMKLSKVTVDNLDLISYSAGPGLGPCLRVGAVIARSLSSYYKIPIYPVNHAIGHIDLGKFLTGANNPLVLLISGGHTMILSFVMKQWRVFGETLDITLGQLIDQFGRHLGFSSPCGKKLEELANNGKNYVSLPYKVKGNDVSFSGLLSAAKNNQSNKEDICYSLQETAFSMIGETVERALAFTGKKELLVVGGVAANQRLSQILNYICKRQNCSLFISPIKFAGDCGSQIALTGLFEATTNKVNKLEDAFINQTWRIDSVQIDY